MVWPAGIEGPKSGSWAFKTQMAKKDRQTDVEEETLTRERTQAVEPKMYRVVLLNDHYTTMEFVVYILETVFKKEPEEARRVMMNVHEQGAGTAGVYTKEIAETKVTIVHHLARQSEYPLRCEIEPV